MFSKIKFFLFALCFILTFIACNENDGITKEQEALELEKMLSEITELANSEVCNDANDWKFTSYGSKACGGPIGFIAYSTNINTEIFFNKIENHRKAQENFNTKWGVVSDCSISTPPNSIKCENGKPVLIY